MTQPSRSLTTTHLGALVIRDCRLAVGTRVLIEDLHLAIPAGEIVTIMGSSGSGKSTLLNWLVGISASAISHQGEIWLDGQRIDTQLPEQRGLGLLFQQLGLFPHLDTEQNLLIGIPNHYSKRQRRELAEKALQEAGLTGMGKRPIQSLSGGEQARVALLRTLLSEPKALLLDEPFSALDDTRRAQIRQFTYARIAEQGLPTLLVTHDTADIPPGAASRVIQLTGNTTAAAGTQFEETFARAAERTDFKAYEAEKVEFTRSK